MHPAAHFLAREIMRERLAHSLAFLFDGGGREIRQGHAGIGGAEAFGKFQKMMWDSAAAMGKKDGR
jgi:hypothetical protein